MPGDLAPALLRIEGLTPSDPGRPGVEVVAWSWSETMSGTYSTGGGGGASRVQMGDLCLCVRPDPSTPRLFEACASGQHIQEARLSAGVPGGTLLLDLADVIITSFTLGGSEGLPGLRVDLTLNFAVLKITFDPGGTPEGREGVVRGGWDLRQNKRI